MRADRSLPVPAMLISVVIPVYNERESLEPLTEGIRAAVEGHELELLFVDDGSTDGSLEEIKRLGAGATPVHFIAFRRNFGKSAAINAGFRAAKGEVVITMDADLQDDPAEIPRFLERLEAGADLVSGWKQQRNDPVTKTLPSRVFNWITRRMTGLPLHDFNCGFKAYRREVVDELDVYGELHRLLPALASWRGFRVEEMPVRHHARRFGHSKFGLERFLRGLFDLLTVYFLTSYTGRPMHLFGNVGLVTGTLGVLALVYLYAEKLLTGDAIGPRPLLFISFFLMGAGLQIILFGLLAELLISQRRRPGLEDYAIRERG